MGIVDLFYPNRKRQYQPKYKNSCNCEDCHQRAHSYGQAWRNKTPVCTCCDCMSKAGLSIPHSYSTHNHVQAGVHTCAMTGQVRHSSSTGSAHCCGPFSDEPLPKYSLTPHTTHKVDNACGSRHYATPLHAPLPPRHVVHQSHHHAPCDVRVYDERTYLSMPNSFHPCNR
ncbi:hypothetical protein GGI04_004026 [Coemansia thaxteri]|uniref:Uncharacterized protein n=1 Tax=Coemansia thaxteri TaxID=2663907 RepID=A0A9W8BE08_9FUNG|nr:hypothetical protein GGI04_004026 [Coemansia thaxteri]KAJ2002202.1 hypothetical protein H4R26_003728 [Coemansia thaxteri]KAJ2461914.1 hypothetical protein GGI02_005583 [Coemansia sp. RSA 2322]